MSGNLKLIRAVIVQAEQVPKMVIFQNTYSSERIKPLRKRLPKVNSREIETSAVRRCVKRKQREDT